ncbi:MAG TPA: Crp/Fnr family transcriptional regulator [Pyrinomonadaceae bacterium]|jgi:CRP-like cAMP-binding protein|nr:Crp/Fnr family transcriptional regulator [Pyrinomonadaceae bacterium]
MSPLNSLPLNNKLLAALPKKDYEGLHRHLEEVPLVFGDILYRPNTPITDVYFPNSGIISLLAGVNERSTLEVGFVGDNGMVGLDVFLGVNSSPNRAVVQGAGSALKMKATNFRRKCQSNDTLPRLLNRYAHNVLLQVTQYAVCNQFHTVDARLARWLLMTSDRMGDNEFQLTQEFMSNMLGVRREGVSVAAGNLQKRKLIRYSRGRLQVLDRLGLEATACSCYAIIKSTM